MINGKKRKSGVDQLRKKAEELALEPSGPEDLSLEEVRRIVHELRVHQIELEMQNEALRETQAELIESNEKYADLYDFAPVGYLTLDEKCVILEANLTLAKQLGIERGSLAGIPFSNFIAPHEKDAFRSHVAKVFETREQLTFEATLVRRHGGSELYAQIQGIFVEDARGRKQCRISVTDISERRRAEDALNVYMKKLEKSNEALQEFASIASHDMHEPLRKIVSFGDQLKSRCVDSLDATCYDYLDRMQNAAKRMQTLLDALLDYARVTTRVKPPTPVDLNELVREVMNDLEILIKQTDAKIEVGSLPTIEVDPNQMRQLFQNLIANALKFQREEKPLVRIHAEADGGQGLYRIFIEDNGIGFDEEYIDRIFAPFQRLHGRSEFEGSGMGLAICRKIIERHGGSITAKSSPGRGSTFIVKLPSKQTSPER